MKEKNQLREAGFVMVPSKLDVETATHWVRRIEESLPNLANQVGCSLDEYLMSVSAWSGKNPLVHEFAEVLRSDITSTVEAITGGQIELLESKLLMKGENCPWATHAHQDIAYRWQGKRQQYQFSTWLSLSTIGPMQAPLEFLPKSHLEPVSEYQDYLDPEFVDRKDTQEWKKKHQSIVMNPGDMVIFDSRVWHASSEWAAPPRRYAMVLRWIVAGIKDTEVPSPRGERRWMYNFSTWLEQSLQKLIDEKSQPSESSLNVAIGLDSISAELKSLLHRYRINRAAGIHHGGTAQRGMLWGPLAEAVRAELRARDVDAVALL